MYFYHGFCVLLLRESFQRLKLEHATLQFALCLNVNLFIVGICACIDLACA